MELSAIQAAVYEECGYQSSPASAVVTRILRTINEGLRLILAEPGMGRLLDSDGPLTVASVASTPRIVLPEAVASIRAVTERTNDRALRAMSLEDYRAICPDPTAVTGTPTHYVPIGRVAVAVQPSAATELFVDSTAAGDVGNAYVEGVITGGYTRTAYVQMTGATEVSLSSAITSFIEVTDFYLAAAAQGTVTLWQGTAGPPIVLGTELARITIGAKRPRYYACYLYPTPSAAVTYYVDYRREVVDLANATDEPPLPTDYHPMLVAYAVLREYEQKGDVDRVQIAKVRWDSYRSRLKYQTQTGLDELPVMGRRQVTGMSRLGGWFPPDTWR